MAQTNKCIVLMLMLAIFTPIGQLGANNFQRMGDILQFAVPVYAFGLSCGEEGYEGTKQFIYSLAGSQLCVHVLKETTHQKRPDYQEGRKKNSFPSGHTSSAFMGASFIHRRYGFRQAIVPYGLAIATGISRVQAKKHYTRDVIAGAAISCLWTWFCVERRTNIIVDSDGEFTKIAYEVNF
ncbi:MAG: phosphatase PAP2 family protein [Puniceicoccales bacterium]|jgi:membrane-associated phospholipid phosphatase|nr:phosphatase PAP2 family protein [Puniceicoccales bacterium]